jgi:predicted dienelactone hydrolase
LFQPLPPTLTHKPFAKVFFGLAIFCLWPISAPAAERLTLKVAGLEIPVEVQQLEDWAKQPKENRELGPWLNLLEQKTQQNIRQLLLQPLPLQGNSIGPLLNSWAGQELVQQLGALLRPPQGDGGDLLLNLVQQQQLISVLDLLKGAPTPELRLDLDALTELAEKLRDQLQQQISLQKKLRGLALPPLVFDAPKAAAINSEKVSLPVAHRLAPIPLQLWWPQEKLAVSHWLLISHGLGGSIDQLAWLGHGLAAQGWPVVSVQHQGSDVDAVRGLLEGREPLPGIETLPVRIKDFEAVSAAIRDQQLRFGSQPTPPRFVMLGHSLGGTAGLLWAGAELEPGLKDRCRKAMGTIPVLDSSYLLQCQLTKYELPQLSPPNGLSGVVSINGFGSLLWGRAGLRSLQLPVLMLGGSLDLVTSPVREQLLPFQQLPNPRSRFAVVERASHFSAVRVEKEQPLMQLGADFVGLNPLQVQNMLLEIQTSFLRSNEEGYGAPLGEVNEGSVRAYVIDKKLLKQLQSLNQSSEVDAGIQ